MRIRLPVSFFRSLELLKGRAQDRTMCGAASALPAEAVILKEVLWQSTHAD